MRMCDRAGQTGTPQLGNLPLRALVCDGAITGWLGYGYLRMRDYGSSLYMPSTKSWFLADVRETPMRISTEDPWTLTEIG